MNDYGDDYGDYGDDDDYGGGFGSEDGFDGALKNAQGDFGFDVGAFGNDEAGDFNGGNDDSNVEEERLIGHLVSPGKNIGVSKRDHIANVIK